MHETPATRALLPQVLAVLLEIVSLPIAPPDVCLRPQRFLRLDTLREELAMVSR